MFDKKAYMKEWREKNKESIAQYNTNWWHNNKEERNKRRAEKRKIYNRTRRKELQHIEKNSYLIRNYGITLDEYNSILAAQNNVCAICKKEEIKSTGYKIKNDLAVDHDHSTGKPRGLLCYRCNTTLGKVNENITILEAMVNYLKRF